MQNLNPWPSPLQCDVAPKKHFCFFSDTFEALRMAAGRAHRSNAGAKMAGLLDKEVDFLYQCYISWKIVASIIQ